MILYHLILAAFLSSTAVSDSERMAAQFTEPTFVLASATIPDDGNNTGKEPQ